LKKIRVAVTGGAGNICYSLLFRIGSGEVFGLDTHVDLVILERDEAMAILEGVKMELVDCSFPLLSSVKVTTLVDEAFEGIDYAFLVGAKPRCKGAERCDLLEDNAIIFQAQGKALNRSKNAKVLVVGNPCNTNALILSSNAKDMDPVNIRAMSRLDQNRAKAQIAIRAGVEISSVKNVGIFGNHSASMVTDYLHAEINGKRAVDVIEDLSFFQSELFQKVAHRGSEILETRGLSSAASAANAAIDAMRDWIGLNGSDESYSAAIYSTGNPYSITDDLYFSFPIKEEKIVEGLKMDSFLEEKIKATEKELLLERDSIKAFLV
jgi:malate dehydrogenase